MDGDKPGQAVARADTMNGAIGLRISGAREADTEQVDFKIRTIELEGKTVKLQIVSPFILLAFADISAAWTHEEQY